MKPQYPKTYGTVIEYTILAKRQNRPVESFTPEKYEKINICRSEKRRYYCTGYILKVQTDDGGVLTFDNKQISYQGNSYKRLAIGVRIKMYNKPGDKRTLYRFTGE